MISNHNLKSKKGSSYSRQGTLLGSNIYKNTIMEQSDEISGDFISMDQKSVESFSRGESMKL